MNKEIKFKLQAILAMLDCEYCIFSINDGIKITFPFICHLDNKISTFIDYFIHNGFIKLQNWMPSTRDYYISDRIEYDGLTKDFKITYNRNLNRYKIVSQFSFDDICDGLSDYIYYILDPNFNDFKFDDSKEKCDELFRLIEEKKQNYIKNNVHFLKSKKEAIHRFYLLKSFFIDTLKMDVVSILEYKNKIECSVNFPNMLGYCSFINILTDYLKNMRVDINHLNIEEMNIVKYTNQIYTYNIKSKKLTLENKNSNEEIVYEDELPFYFNDVLYYFLPVIYASTSISYNPYPDVGSIQKDLKKLLDRYVKLKEKSHPN